MESSKSVLQRIFHIGSSSMRCALDPPFHHLGLKLVLNWIGYIESSTPKQRYVSKRWCPAPDGLTLPLTE